MTGAKNSALVGADDAQRSFAADLDGDGARRRVVNRFCVVVERRDIRDGNRRARLEALARVQTIQQRRRGMKPLCDFFGQRAVAERGRLACSGKPAGMFSTNGPAASASVIVYSVVAAL